MLRAMQSSSKPLIYLASASPRRSVLLAQVGVPHSVVPVDIDESIHGGEAPAEYVKRLASSKAEVLWGRLAAAERLPVLAADTSVAMDQEILGKPADQADGLRMLRMLSGRTHQVFTAVALKHEHGCETTLNVSEVSFRRLSEEEMQAYWSTNEPRDKAGGYAVQGIAALFIDRIAGSFSGIMGLPLFETANLLRTIGWQLANAVAR
jgi:septum formation protein